MTLLEHDERPRRGPKPRGGQRRSTFSFRLAHALREKLELSAAWYGISLAEEIERRLLYSFDHLEMVEAVKNEIRMALAK